MNSGRSLVLGGRGFVGSAIVRRLSAEEADPIVCSSPEGDLTDLAATIALFQRFRPSTVFAAAGLTGSILESTRRPVEFLESNLLIQLNVLRAAKLCGVERLLMVGTASVYPDSERRLKESDMLTGIIPPSNEPYGLARSIGARLCEYYRKEYGCQFFTATPANMFGPGDRFDATGAHVIPAMISKLHVACELKARTVEFWGTGDVRREFLYVDDFADACIFLMKNYDSGEHINVGSGDEIRIRDLAEMLRELVCPAVEIRWDVTKPEGASRRILDTSKLRSLGWSPSTTLRQGLGLTWDWFRARA